MKQKNIKIQNITAPQIPDRKTICVIFKSDGFVDGDEEGKGKSVGNSVGDKEGEIVGNWVGEEEIVGDSVEEGESLGNSVGSGIRMYDTPKSISLHTDASLVYISGNHLDSK